VALYGNASRNVYMLQFKRIMKSGPNDVNYAEIPEGQGLLLVDEAALDDSNVDDVCGIGDADEDWLAS